MRSEDADGAAEDIAGFSGARLGRLSRFLDIEVAKGCIPGAVLLIERHGKTVLKRAWGYRDRAAGAPMTLDTIFRLYSMTKPVVSVAALMLAAEGRLTLAQPISDFIPAFAATKVLQRGALVEPDRPPTVQDLLRHTSGLTYQSNGGAVGALYEEAGLMAGDLSNEAFAERIATLPLAHQPGRVWEYGYSTDVLGRVVEVAAGRSLSAVLKRLVLAPLGMGETEFWVPDAARRPRIAASLPGDGIAGRGALFDPRVQRAFEAGGMGLVSTLDDYARFARMLLSGGTAADKTVVVSRRLLRFMMADHIGPGTGIIKQPTYMPGPGFGFGLGLAVRLAVGEAAYPGSIGECNWSGVAGTYFWIDPEEDLLVVLLTQAPRERLRLRAVVKMMV